MIQRCGTDRAPKGWVCTRDRFHAGPCAGVVHTDELSYAQVPDGRGMVRIGPSEIHLYHNLDGKCKVTPYGFVAEEFWTFVEDFLSPLASEPGEMDTLDTPRWHDVLIYASDIERRYRLNPQRGVCWTFAAVSSDGKTQTSLTAIMGKGNLVKWGWFRAHVRHPILRMYAWFKNLFN